MTWLDIAMRELCLVDDANQRRSPRDLRLQGPRGSVAATDAPIVTFASNDYLGLTQHEAVKSAAAQAALCWGSGSGSARLIVGSRRLHSELEATIAQWRGTESSVLFSTGFAANLGVVTTFGAHAAVICSDALNHASIIDGCRQAKARTEVYPHCDVDAVDRSLEQAVGPGMVVTDSVFSMDGDLAPIVELAQCCATHGALLVLDDAHAVFELEDLSATGAEVLRVGTLSKTTGSLGGYVAGPEPMCDLLVNRARSYIFTTAGTPADMAASSAAISVIQSTEGETLRAKLRDHIDRLRPGHTSPIIPVVLGDEADAVDAASELESRGLIVPAIRPPTVPRGTSRLRVTVSAAHEHEEIDRLLCAFEELGIDPS